MWHQFISFKEFAKLQTKVTFSSGNNILLLSILSVILCLMLIIIFVLFNTKNPMMDVYCTYNFTSGFMIQYLTYCKCAQMGVHFF